MTAGTRHGEAQRKGSPARASGGQGASVMLVVAPDVPTSTRGSLAPAASSLSHSGFREGRFGRRRDPSPRRAHTQPRSLVKPLAALGLVHWWQE